MIPNRSDEVRSCKSLPKEQKKLARIIGKIIRREAHEKQQKWELLMRPQSFESRKRASSGQRSLSLPLAVLKSFHHHLNRLAAIRWDIDRGGQQPAAPPGLTGIGQPV